MNQSGEIRMYLESPSQMLFDENRLYRKRKIRKDAEEFIIEEAKVFPRETSIKIIIYLQTVEAGNEDSFVAAIHKHFANCSARTDSERKRTMQYGWRALAIAFVVLGVAVTVTQMLANVLPQNGIVGATIESLTILGWVAFWKPTELLLYAWYPYSRDKALYTRLEQSEVHVVNMQEDKH